jgi:hypothetical protein
VKGISSTPISLKKKKLPHLLEAVPLNVGPG